MKKKKMIRLLKKEAEKIPDEEYEVLNKFFKPKFRDPDGVIHDEPGKEGDPKRRMIFAVVEKCKVNHGRRIKKLYNQYGMAAVDAYFFVKAGMVQQQYIK